MKCNHEYCKTEFCPHCGVRIISGPLDALRQHLRNVIKSAEKSVQHHAREAIANPDSQYIKKCHTRALHVLADRKSWLEALEDLIGGSK